LETFEQILARHSFFKTMEPDYLKLLEKGVAHISFMPDTYVFHEGEKADKFYIILHGKISMEIFAAQKGAVVIQTLGADEVLGWSWLFPPYRWHFDARVVEETSGLVLDGKFIRQACEENHDFGYEVMRRVGNIMLGRLQATRLQLLDVYELHN
jgi:CRP-like cAMP-binding protein